MLFISIASSQYAFAEQTEMQLFDCLLIPEQEVIVSSTESGVIENINIKKGDIVKKGDVLITLESNVEKILVELADLKRNTNFEIDASKKNADLAKSKLKRMVSLQQENITSEKEKEDAISELNIAELNYEQALQNKRLAETDYKRAVAILNKKSIKSEIDGIVTDIYLHIGEIPKDNKILKIVKIDPMHIEVIMPSYYFGKINLDMMANIITENKPNDKNRATVINVDKVIDAESGTFVVTLSMPNDDLSIPSGQKCEVIFDNLPQKGVQELGNE